MQWTTPKKVCYKMGWQMVGGCVGWLGGAGKALTMWRLLSMTGQIKCNKACCKTRKNENQ